MRDLGDTPKTFSARSLEPEFDSPRAQRLTTRVGSIHKTLSRAFADEKIVAFIDDAGTRLREEEFTAPGSAAVEHPYIYGMAGTPAPVPGFHPITYREWLAAGATGDDIAGTDNEVDHDRAAAADERPDDRAHAGGNATASAADEPSDEAVAAQNELDNEDLVERVMDWRASEPAPEWLPDELMRHYVTTNRAVACWKRGLNEGPLDERRALIRAGVRRKGSIAPDSVTAGELVKLCRASAAWWDRCASAALAHYGGTDGAVPNARLSELVEDPLTFASECACAREPLVLVGLMLRLDPDALELIALDAIEVDENGGVDADVEARLRHRAEALQYELDELNAELRRRDADERTAAKEIERLRGELARLEDVAKRAGDEQLAAERATRQEHLARIAELEAQLDAAADDRARVVELEESLREMERLRLDLDARQEALERERTLRAEAEIQVQDGLRRVRELTTQLRATEQSAVQLPVDDPAGLLRALGGLAGQAAQLAGSRLLSGQATAADSSLLRLAAAYGEIALPAAGSDAPVAAATDQPPLTGGDAPTPVPETADVGGVATAPEGAAELKATPSELKPAAEDATQPVTETASEPDVAETGDEPGLDEENIGASDGRPGAAPERTPAPRGRRRRSLPPFTVRAIGGAEEIGASAILVQTRDGQSSVLLDAGQRVKGEYGADDVGQFHYGVPGVEHLDAVLVSHAHIDHVGSLPLLAESHADRHGQAVAVWMTEPTADLARIMLEDSAKIQHFREQHAKALAESDFAPNTIGAAYTLADVAAVMDDVRIAERAQPIPIPNTPLVAKFLPVSHVLGSCAINLKDTETGGTLLYTGDLGPISDPQFTLPDFGGSSGLEGADLVIMESTYGQLRAEEREGRRRRSEGRERALRLLADAAQKAIGAGGFVLLPSFSLGRTQELATIIGQERGRSLPDGPIYVGGMGLKITEVYDKYGTARRGSWARPYDIPDVNPINNWLEEGAAFDTAVHNILSDERRGYIIASPAMVSGGWSRAFLREMVGGERHAVVFTGYLPRHAGGIPNLNRMHTGATLRLNDESIKIRCQWERAGLSAHAPARDLRRFAEDLSRGRDHTAFGIVHGEAPSQQELAAFINDSVVDAAATSLEKNVPWRPARP